LSAQTDIVSATLSATGATTGVLTVDLDALARNFRRLQQLAAPA
jgi:hypothetical protein